MKKEKIGRKEENKEREKKVMFKDSIHQEGITIISVCVYSCMKHNLIELLKNKF